MIVVENNNNLATIIHSKQLFEKEKDNINKPFMVVDKLPPKEDNNREFKILVDVENEEIWYEYGDLIEVIEVEEPLSLEDKLENLQELVDAMLGVSEE